MATTEQHRAALDRYIELFSAGEAGAWSELFAVDADHEDPVGTPPNEGRPGILAFYENTRKMFGSVSLRATQPPIVIGNEAVMTLEAVFGEGEGRARIPHIVDVIKFDESGDICSLRAFWDMASLTPDPE